MPPISTRVAFLRPMYWARMPSGKRMRAPAKMGMDNISPICEGLRFKDSLMKGAMAPLVTQTPQQ